MFSKSVFKKYKEQLDKEEKLRKFEVCVDSNPIMQYVSVGIKPDRETVEYAKLKCLIDTGSGFLLSLPLSMSTQLKGFRRIHEHDKVGVGVGDVEIKQKAVCAYLVIAGVEFECICHFTDGIEEPILGMPLFLEHLDLSISKGVARITPTKKP